MTMSNCGLPVRNKDPICKKIEVKDTDTEVYPKKKELSTKKKSKPKMVDASTQTEVQHEFDKVIEQLIKDEAKLRAKA
tara:strand:- start:149 stop:382 length:234 start_codon:yes stop_codon:yes gene_type:complete